MLGGRPRVYLLQTEGVFNRTLEAIKGAGGVLVPFNASGMVEYHDKYIGDSTFYTMELGGALSRWGRHPSTMMPQMQGATPQAAHLLHSSLALATSQTVAG